MVFDKFTSDEKIAYLIKPILKALQEAGGQLERSAIKETISDMDDNIAQYAENIKISKGTGKPYKEFDFKFNFALKELLFLEYVTYARSKPVTLTNKGIEVNISELDVENEIIIPSKKFWLELSEKKKQGKPIDTEEVEEIEEEDAIQDSFKDKLLNAIEKMSPKKFEAFSRALLSKMGVEFTEKGTQVSADGGIDGYGYHLDQNDFRTTRVVIQCKRFNATLVGSPDIDKFLGAMNKHKADYGVFITNSKFTKAAKDAAREGTPITLIDRDDIVRLVKKYELYITPVTTYILDNFYED